jgi:hypothetical protein
MITSVTLAGIVLAIVASTGTVTTVPEDGGPPEVLMSTQELSVGHSVLMDNATRWSVARITPRSDDSVVVTLKGSGRRPPELGIRVPVESLEVPMWYVREPAPEPAPGPEPTPEAPPIEP